MGVYSKRHPKKTINLAATHRGARYLVQISAAHVEPLKIIQVGPSGPIGAPLGGKGPFGPLCGEGALRAPCGISEAIPSGGLFRDSVCRVVSKLRMLNARSGGASGEDLGPSRGA